MRVCPGCALTQSVCLREEMRAQTEPRAQQDGFYVKRQRALASTRSPCTEKNVMDVSANSVVLGALRRAVQQEEERHGIQIGKEAVILPLFPYDIMQRKP